MASQRCPRRRRGIGAVTRRVTRPIARARGIRRGRRVRGCTSDVRTTWRGLWGMPALIAPSRARPPPRATYSTIAAISRCRASPMRIDRGSPGTGSDRTAAPRRDPLGTSRIAEDIGNRPGGHLGRAVLGQLALLMELQLDLGRTLFTQVASIERRSRGRRRLASHAIAFERSCSTRYGDERAASASSWASDRRHPHGEHRTDT